MQLESKMRMREREELGCRRLAVRREHAPACCWQIQPVKHGHRPAFAVVNSFSNGAQRDLSNNCIIIKGPFSKRTTPRTRRHEVAGALVLILS